MTEKEEFITALKNRTKKFAVDIINFCETLKTVKASSIITYQIVKSATSTGANYRAACRARSSNEFYSKICIVVEEIDETEYWLEIIKNAKLTENLTELNRLLIEANELVKIMSKAKYTASDRKNKKH
ncbi:MAG: four helix bundle protein [Flavobacteriales bacterium]